MFVSNEFRRMSVGKKLVESFVESAIEKKAEWVRVSALIGNTSAHEFYKSLGFETHEVVFEKAIAKS